MDKVIDLLRNYRDIINKLKVQGVIRSSNVVSNYGEYLACKKLGLKLASTSNNKGYDAIDKGGRKYEIKTRKATSWNNPTRFPIKRGQLKLTDFVIYVEFDDDWKLVKFLKIPSKELQNKTYDFVMVTKDLVKRFSI